jgi:hypothetical protein
LSASEPGEETLTGQGGRARRELNADTVREMHRAFREHGREAIDNVIRTQPAAFLKLLVLLIPREFQIEGSSAIKSMTDEQLEAGIEVLQRYLDARPRRSIRAPVPRY